jgi:integrase
LRYFEKDVFPGIGDRPATEIKRGDIRAILNRVTDRGAARAAKVLLGDLRQMFTYAVSIDCVATDPTYGFKKRDFGGQDKPRERTLSPDEIRELANTLPTSGLAPAYQSAIWVMLATSCRVGELMKARWMDVDLDAGEWRIPAENSKNGRAHLIHLSPFARQHFAALPRFDECEWLFPGRDIRKHLDAKALNKQLQDRQRESQIAGRSLSTGALRLPGGNWTPHDLRRTGSTLMGELGIRPDIINRCQNHALGDRVTQTYQRQELLDDRRRAFQRLGQHLADIISSEPGKVASFPNARRIRRGVGQ